MSKHVVAPVSEIPPGSKKLVTVRGQPIVIFNLDGVFYGLFNRCPWHGWEFDIRTGQSWCEPARIKVRSCPVEVAHGEELVQGPYVAETVKVAIEDDYVVVDV